MITRHHEIVCDSCGLPNDGDPIDALSTIATIPPSVRDPRKKRDLSYFWLCPDCAIDYPDGISEFFTQDYLTEDLLYLCIHCDDFIPEDVRDAYPDTEVCDKCAYSSE